MPESPDPTIPRAPHPVPEGLRETGGAGDTRSRAVGSRAAGPPTRLARFEVRRLLGEGAFALVYLAYDPDLNREVAVKVPKAEALTPEFRDTFIRENRLAAIIHHANVCPVYEIGTHDGVPYIVMRVVPETLAGLLQKLRAPMPARTAVAVARKLALGLAAAHAQNVIHRDLKPANVLYDDANREVLIADFGLARFADQATAASNGVPKGTPAYMAPEQARGQADKIGPHSDLYALGVILYELLTGRVPFAGSVWEVMRDHCEKAPVPPSAARAGLDPKLDALCLKALAKDPKDRYRSAKEFAQAMADYLRAGATPVVAPEPAWASVELTDEPPVPRAAAAEWVLVERTTEPPVPAAAAKSVPPPLPPVSKSQPVPPPVPRAAPLPVARPVAKRVRAELGPEFPSAPDEPKPRALKAKLFWGGLVALLVVGTAAGLAVSLRDRAGDKGTNPTAGAAELERDWADYRTAIYSAGDTNTFVAERGPLRASEWKRAADAGHSRPAVLYARCLQAGAGVPNKDPVAAFQLFQRVADREPLALVNLGLCWESGNGTEKDPNRALELFRRAADTGEPRGMTVLGMHYAKPEHPAHDYKKAREWYEKADAASDSEATYRLAWLFDQGRGSDENLPRAHELFLKAANQGHTAARFQTGRNFHLARGTTENYAEARKWYELAADRGSAVAMNNLGVLYDYGKGVKQNSKTALEWFQKGAELGEPTAAYNLGKCYEDGNGAPVNLPLALDWYKKALANGNDNAKAAIKRLEAKK